MNYFLELYGHLPRAGPGADDLTRAAFELMPHLPVSSRILDVGCGPGKQTVELLHISNAVVVALDILPEMIARVRTEAQNAGVSHRLETSVQDMNQMLFPAASFDVVWCEAAIYNLGFENGLRKFRDCVKPGGYIAVSEAVWLKPNPPPELAAFWQEYPEIDTVAAKLEIARRNDLEVLGHFIFPKSAWTRQYYDPLVERIAEKAKAWGGIPEAEAVLSEAKNEVSMFLQYSDYFGYAFLVMRRP